MSEETGKNSENQGGNSPIRFFDSSTGVTRLFFNRPDRCNALSLRLLEDFDAFLESLSARSDCRVLVLEGMGSHFCSGLDLREASAEESFPPLFVEDVGANLMKRRNVTGLPRPLEMTRRVVRILAAIQRLPQVVVAAVRGAAIGGGGGMVAVSDYVVATEGAFVGFPELARGLRPSLLHPFLARKLSPTDYKTLLFPGKPISAEVARRMGLFQEIVPESELATATKRVEKEILNGSPQATVAAKRVLNAALVPSDEEITAGLLDHWRSWSSEEARNGVAAFLDRKRK